ncbi:autotransporter outer membrane beta-barrel domain-containing protein [Bradyrhizobium erythrophlei]|uniref:autotransporter family protein n=1 Tax=Bradyrhizobium erythrophlei TaxID=1437360 RepID=UPI0035EEDC28
MNFAAPANNEARSSWVKMSRRHLMAGAALLALGAPAGAQTIDTIPQWNGLSFIWSWGTPNTATYGQTFTPTASQTRLNGFTVEIGFGGAPNQAQAYVYQWDSVNKHITGSALYTSGVFTATPGASYSAYSFNSGGVTLTPGQQYVLFISTSNQQVAPGNPEAGFRWGALTNNTAIPNGQFVFQNNGSNFAELSTVGWSFIPEDLAITIALYGFLNPLLPANTPINPTNVAAGIDKAIAAGLTLPAGFNNLFSLPPAQLVDALGALSGENHTQAQQGAFQLGNSYLSLLTDPFATNRIGTATVTGFAPERESMLPSSLASAYAKYIKAPPLAVYQPRWDVWGAAFGGANNTSGDAAVVGSHDAYTRVGGVAAGADYRFSPNALIGFSLAGGNTAWTVSGNGFGGNGGGNSDAFMAGIYGKYSNGAGYVLGALTYANYWMSTSRTVTVAGLDQLKADFNAESWGGRIEGGYRLPGQFLTADWTPYAAFQAQSFRTPNYGEVATVGSNHFALNFASRTATAYRGEVGLRSGRVTAVDNGGQLTLFGKLAYAHDEITDPQAAANFTAFGLGAAPFVVYGAKPSRELALTTAGAEWRLTNGISFLAKFDGEFGDRSQTYSGTGRIRYTW